MKKRILVVEDLDMKKVDSWIEFHRSFLIAAKARNIEVHFVLPKEPCENVISRLRDVDFRYIVFDNWWNKHNAERRNNIALALVVTRILLKGDYDLVEFDFCYELSVFLITIFAKLMFKKTRFIWRQHSQSGMMRNQRKLSEVIKRYCSKMRVISWLIDQVIVLSECQKQVFVKRGILAKKIQVVPTGINLDKYVSVRNGQLLMKQFDLSNFQFAIMTVASLIPDKGINFLLDAAQIVLKKYSKVCFLIVGDGPEAHNLKAQAKRLKIENNVIFMGLRNDIPELLSTADIFVLPTLAEAMSFSILEAMSSGKPIIASDVGGIPEVVQHQYNGFLIPPKHPEVLADHLLLLIDNSNLREIMGKRSIQIVEQKFNLNSSIERTWKIFDFCLAKL
ncbi:MAG TPA: glycosyltransferase [Candidatus Omnitrophota bacterium]|nr:glycosyltransferase [Candidatus Omnitrophota bacterium]